MKCPHCKAFGPKHDELEEHWEVRGQFQGKPVRRCRTCGGGFFLRRLRSPEAIPADLWAELETAWVRTIGTRETDDTSISGVRQAAEGSEPGALSKQIYRGLAAQMAETLGTPLDQLNERQLYFIAGWLEGVAIFENGATEQEAQVLAEEIGAPDAERRTQAMLRSVKPEALSGMLETCRQQPTVFPRTERAILEEVKRRELAAFDEFKDELRPIGHPESLSQQKEGQPEPEESETVEEPDDAKDAESTLGRDMTPSSDQTGFWDTLPKELTRARDEIERLGRGGPGVHVITTNSTRESFDRSQDLIVEFAEAEVHAEPSGVSPRPTSAPPRFAEVFRAELEQADATLAELFGLDGAAARDLIARPIANLITYGFAACAMRQHELREAGEPGLEPDRDLGAEEIRDVWVGRIDAERERLRNDRELGHWFAQVCSPGFTSFIRSAGQYGIIEARHATHTAEFMVDAEMVKLGKRDVAEAYPGAHRVDPFLAFYAEAGWTLYLANTPLWY